MIRAGPHLRRALGTSAWLVGERGVTLCLNFLVSVLLARYLGPESYGALSYATAVVALLAAITYLGFGGVVVQELVRAPEARGEIMGVVIYSKLAAACLAAFLVNLFAHFAVPDDGDRLLIFLISFSMLFDVAIGLRLHFEALTEARSIVAIAAGTSLFGAAARLVAIGLGAPLWVFAAIISIQSMVAAAGYTIAYRQSAGRTARLSFSMHRARLLFRRSWPLMISFVASVVYLKIDQFMLGQMRGMAEVGTYAIAARLSEIWYVVPTAIVTSVFPRLVTLRAEDNARYEQRVQDSIRYLFLAGLTVAVFVTLVAQPLIALAFGEEYREAATILAIHVWACPAVYMGIVVEKWLVAEDLLKFFIGRQIVGAIVNVALNLLLIPSHGGIGSAVATVVSYTLAYYVFCFADKRTRPAAVWMTGALVWPVLRLQELARSRA